MPKPNDEELIALLRERFSANRRAINDLQELTAKLEAINRRLQDSEALRGHFLSNIRNEINNPLAAIMGIASCLMEGNTSPEQAAFSARMMFEEAVQLHFQLENVFTAAGLEAGQEMPIPEDIDAAHILGEILDRLEHRRLEKGIEIRREAPNALPFTADPGFVQIILRNLVANALEFTPQQGEVEITLGVADRQLRFAIRNSGSGIDSELHDTVFDRFRQLDWGSCKSHRGLGLGLSICRSLAELAGGTLVLESAPDDGCTFILTLPEAEAAPIGGEENSFLQETEQF